MEKPWQVIVLRDINCPESNKKKQELKEEVEMHGGAKKCTNKNCSDNYIHPYAGFLSSHVAQEPNDYPPISNHDRTMS